MLPHLLIHLPLLNIFLPNLTRVIMWLLNDPLYDWVLQLSLRPLLLLVRGLSSHRAIGLDILDVSVVLHHNIQLVLLQ